MTQLGVDNAEVEDRAVPGVSVGRKEKDEHQMEEAEVKPEDKAPRP